MKLSKKQKVKKPFYAIRGVGKYPNAIVIPYEDGIEIIYSKNEKQNEGIARISDKDARELIKCIQKSITL